jgi:hypothetical protein
VFEIESAFDESVYHELSCSRQMPDSAIRQDKLFISGIKIKWRLC